MAKRSAGLAVDYLVSRYGTFVQLLDPTYNRYIAYQTSTTRTSVVNLILNADDIVFIVNKYQSSLIIYAIQ
jgi:cytochrome c-type biogenesis protein CcmH/NrfF